MPDLVIHVAFGRDVRGSLPEDIRPHLADDPFNFALLGPDVWFTFQPWKRREGRGRCMHTTASGDFLMALADRAKSSASHEPLFSYLTGFLCHYALDSVTHPYIIYMTEEKYHYSHCHTSFEHSLDNLELCRASCRDQNHPVTKHYFPARPLPASIRADIDAVYEQVYGWKDCWRLLNRCFHRFRLFYRTVENRKGLFSRIARLTGSEAMKSFSYSDSHFNDSDVENLEKAVWCYSHDHSLQSSASFPEMRDEARSLAVSMITAAWRYVFRSELSRDDLAKIIGNRSYLSGFSMDDPRNLVVPSMLPPENPPKLPSASGGGPS